MSSSNFEPEEMTFAGGDDLTLSSRPSPDSSTADIGVGRLYVSINPFFVQEMRGGGPLSSSL